MTRASWKAACSAPAIACGFTCSWSTLPTDAHFWAERYDRELTAANIFAIQSEVATAIAGALQASLTASEQARVSAIPTQSLEAWQAYQLGKQRMAHAHQRGAHRGRRAFPQGDRARSEVRARLGRTGGHARAADGIRRPTEGCRPRRGRAGGDPGARAGSEPGRGLGLCGKHREQLGCKFERAEQMLRRAIALNPNYAPAHHWLSFTLLRLGRRNEALAAAERAVVLDPLSAIINNWLGWARMSVGRFDECARRTPAGDRDRSGDCGIVFNDWRCVCVRIGSIRHGDGLAGEGCQSRSGQPGVRGGPCARRTGTLGMTPRPDDGSCEPWRSVRGRGYTNFVAALLYLDRGDEASARAACATGGRDGAVVSCT